MAEVVLLQWPEDSVAGAVLARAGDPVLYLVEPDGEPPRSLTCLEDWVRTSADARDVSARRDALQLRALAHQTPPRIDAGRTLHYRGGRLVLDPTEALLAGELALRFGELVPDPELARIVPAGEPSLRHQMTRLRARLRTVDLQVSRIRRQGYVLKPR